ncbi:MAG: macro domain-containing protein [Anaerolineae bacterium]|nr:macro domain-containing protein [Anaerolineae bacterium]
MKAKVNKVTVSIVQENLMSQSVTAIVNATDTNLALSPGLAERGGAELRNQCRAMGWCDVGDAVITDAGNLPYEKIIHAVGPRWGEGSERAKLALATLRTLQLTEANKLKSLALTPISIGAFGYPLENCAKTMLAQIIDFTFEKLKYLRIVIICVDSDLVYDAFANEFREQLAELRQSGEGEVKV